MNPYGKIFRCKGSFHPQSEEPTYKHVTPTECKRPTLLRLDSTGEISSDDHRSTMTGEKSKRKFSSKCNRMGTFMNSTLMSWSRLSSQKQLMSGNSANNFEILSDIAKNMDAMSSGSHPTKHDIGGTTCYSVPPQRTYPYHCANTFRNKMKGALGINSTMQGQFSPTFNRSFPKDSDFGKSPDTRLPYTNRGNNTYRHWKKHCNRNSTWQHPHRNGEHCKNKSEETLMNEKNRESSESRNKCEQNSDSKENVSTSEVKMNSINMLKNILLQNELLNSAKTKCCDNKSQENISSHLPPQIEKSKETSEPVCDETKDEAKQDCEKVKMEITDWFSMGRSDSIDGTSNVIPLVSVYSATFKKLSDFDHNGAILEKSECEKLETDGKNIEDSSVLEIDKCDLYCPSDEKQTDNSTMSSEKDNKLKHAKMDSSCSEKKESSSSDSKDYSFVLFVRNNNKKCRPSVQKRRRSKARMSDCENSKNQRTRHVSVNIQKTDDRQGKEPDNSECNSEDSSSNAVAFILGFDPSDNDRTRSHSFLVSFSDSEDTDSDFGSEDDGETFSDENFEDFQFASPLNLNVICSVNKPDRPENSKLKALNMAWKINIQVKECKSKANRKVHFADENKLEEVHPIIAWSYAYQAARKGPWEEYARDRERFRNRIMAAEKIISPVLQGGHRQNVYSKYFSDN